MIDDPLSLLSLGIWLLAAGMWPVGFLFAACSQCCQKCRTIIAYERCLKMTPLNPQQVLNPDNNVLYAISERPTSPYRRPIRVLPAGAHENYISYQTRIAGGFFTTTPIITYNSPDSVNGVLTFSFFPASSSGVVFSGWPTPGQTVEQVWRWTSPSIIDAPGQFSQQTADEATPPWHLQINLSLIGILDEQDVVSEFSQYGESIVEIRQTLDSLLEDAVAAENEVAVAELTQALAAFEERVSQIEDPGIEVGYGEDEYGQVLLLLHVKIRRQSATYSVDVTVTPTGKQRWFTLFLDPDTQVPDSPASVARVAGPILFGVSISRGERTSTTVLSRSLVVRVLEFRYGMPADPPLPAVPFTNISYSVDHMILDADIASSFIGGDVAVTVPVRARITSNGAVMEMNVKYQIDPTTALCGIPLSLTNGVPLGIVPPVVGLTGLLQFGSGGSGFGWTGPPCHNTLTMFPISPSSWGRVVYPRRGFDDRTGQPGFTGVSFNPIRRTVSVEDFFGSGCQALTALEEGPLRTVALTTPASGDRFAASDIYAVLDDPGEQLSGPALGPRPGNPNETNDNVCDQIGGPVYSCSFASAEVAGVPPSEDFVRLTQNCTGMIPTPTYPLSDPPSLRWRVTNDNGVSLLSPSHSTLHDAVSTTDIEFSFSISPFRYPFFFGSWMFQQRIDGFAEYDYDSAIAGPFCRMRLIGNVLTQNERTVVLDSMGPDSWSSTTSFLAPGDGPALVRSGAVGSSSSPCSHFTTRHGHLEPGADSDQALRFLHCDGLSVELLDASPPNRRGLAAELTEVSLGPSEEKSGGPLIRLNHKREWRGGEGVVLRVTSGPVTALRELRRTPTPPGVVGLQVSRASGCATATLSWSYPQDDGGSDIIDYRVEFKRIEQSTWTLRQTTTQTSSVITGLTAGGYQFRVRARNFYAAGVWEEKEVDRLLGPSGLAFSRISDCPEFQVLLSWTRPEHGPCNVPVKYEVQYALGASGGSFQAFATVAGTESEAIVSGLTAVADYRIRIRQTDQNGLTITSPSVFVERCPPESPE